jgi:hypothetical protein
MITIKDLTYITDRTFKYGPNLNPFYICKVCDDEIGYYVQPADQAIYRRKGIAQRWGPLNCGTEFDVFGNKIHFRKAMINHYKLNHEFELTVIRASKRGVKKK